MNLKDWEALSGEGQSQYLERATLGERRELVDSGIASTEFKKSRPGIEFEQMYPTTPKMEGNCHPIFEKVAKIHSHAHVVAQVWNAWDIDADRRQESLDLMRKRGEELKETKTIRSTDIKDYFKLIDDLERLNKEDGELTASLKERMEGVTAELAINAILDCGCPESEEGELS